MFTKLYDIVPKVLNHYNLAQLAKAAQVMRRFQDIVVELIGQDVSREIKTVSLNDHKILLISTSHNAVAQEIQLRKPQILKKLNCDFPDYQITDLRFKMDRNLGITR